nr:MAG TPA: hypothetical protein [Caudoviricetes sp.]
MATIKDFRRMCSSIDCTECPFRLAVPCRLCNFTRDADELVDAWVKTHPEKSYCMDFFEKFPNAPKCISRYNHELPTACVMDIYGEDAGCHEDCDDCWNKPMEV